MPIAADVQRSLGRMLAERQVDWRVPGLAAGVVRDGILGWSGGVGAADVTTSRSPAGRRDAVPHRIHHQDVHRSSGDGAQRRREARPRRPADALLPRTKHASLTVRQMLSHASGLQREPVGDIWESLACPDLDQLLAGLEEAERVLPPHHRWHYSNLAYAVLGEVVSRLDGCGWEESLRVRILEPLGLKRTGLVASAPFAVGYFPTRSPTRCTPSPISTRSRPHRAAVSGAHSRIWPAGPRSWPSPTSHTPVEHGGRDVPAADHDRPGLVDRGMGPRDRTGPPR